MIKSRNSMTHIAKQALALSVQYTAPTPNIEVAAQIKEEKKAEEERKENPNENT